MKRLTLWIAGIAVVVLHDRHALPRAVQGEALQKGAPHAPSGWPALFQAYETTPGPDRDGNGKPDWYLPILGSDGQPRVKYDPGIQVVTSTGGLGTGRPGCNATDNSSCTCTANRSCLELAKYLEVPFFMRQAMRDYGLAPPSMKGIY